MIVVSSTAVHVLLVARDSSKLDMAMACAAHDRHQVGAPGGNHQGPGVTKKNIHQMVSAKDLHVLSLIASASLSGLHNHACCHKIEHSIPHKLCIAGGTGALHLPIFMPL